MGIFRERRVGLDGENGLSAFQAACPHRPGGHRVEAGREPLQVRSVRLMAEDQEPGVRAAHQVASSGSSSGSELVFGPCSKPARSAVISTFTRSRNSAQVPRCWRQSRHRTSTSSLNSSGKHMVGQPQASHAYFTTMPPAFFAPYTGQLDRVNGASDSAHNERALKPWWAPRMTLTLLGQ